MSTHSERARQWVHVGSGAFAFLLRGLTWREGAALAAVALAFNVLVLPRIGGRQLYRPVDRARGFPLGILLYPLAVLMLILIFSSRLDIAAAAWGILAFGDGAATLVGQRADGRRWPWNPDKTIAGSAAFVLFASAGGVLLAWWTRANVSPPPSLWFVVLAPVVAAFAAAAVEALPVRLDDNISVPAAAAAILWLASLMTADAVHANVAAVARAAPIALVVNGAVAWAGYRARSVSISGAVGGAIVGVIIYAGAGVAAWMLLLLAFILASVTSRLGLTRKTLLGIAEERGGRRGAGNAFANCGVASLAAVAYVTTPYAAAAMLALATALTAGGSDTVASEIGKAWGRSTFLVTSLGRVKPGTPGAMSIEGTAAGIVAALTLAVISAGFGLIAANLILAVVVGATVGALVESALGATLEEPGILNNDMLNFINTGVAAVVAIAIA
ncbi:MAG TPA: DUF92 domain-containing protein [Vicinamibacterales bacterium]